jgi:preprotein translocase subunit SecF
MNIIGKKNLYFLISLLVIIPGIISLALYGLHLSIDFAGGSRMEIQSNEFKSADSDTKIKQVFSREKVEINSVQKSGQNAYIIRTKPLDDKKYLSLKQDLQKNIKDLKVATFETIGPTIGKETTTNAFKSIVVASLLIVLYIAWSFRSVPKPASSWRFGVCAVVALIHDVLVLVGIFSLLGHFFNVEIDSLFVTAVLTVIGFSVHDTIVVFDRVRENLKRSGSLHFAQVANDSILQTLGRSLNTSLTVILVLATLLLFGGESIRWFVVALLVGIVSGTYSSIFNAAPLLVAWHEWSQGRSKK